MDAATRGRHALAGRRAAVAALSALALLAPAAAASDYDTVGADDRCLEGRDDFRDLDGNGCPEPIVDAGELSARFASSGSGRSLRVRVVSLSLIAGREETVFASCRPACDARVRRVSKRRVTVTIPQTFGYGDLIGVRVWREGHVGRFFGYHLKKRRPRYVACLLRAREGVPRRCHT
ncbi:MAG TPA: hypothetical protein VF712_19805 [Thermoleophilaceae bacterium]|jgi:hypothetical protein